jgi:hypothetical protein
MYYRLSKLQYAKSLIPIKTWDGRTYCQTCMFSKLYWTLNSVSFWFIIVNNNYTILKAKNITAKNLQHNLVRLKARSHYTTITINCKHAIIGKTIVLVSTLQRKWSFDDNDNDFKTAHLSDFFFSRTITINFWPINARIQVIVSLSLCSVTWA